MELRARAAQAKGRRGWRRRRGGGSGGGGNAEFEPQSGESGNRGARPGALGQHQAAEVLNNAAREERDVQGKMQRQSQTEVPAWGEGLVVAALGLIAQVSIVARAPIDTSQGVNFHALLTPDTVYVGQQTTYQVGVFIDDRLRQRLRHNPEFVPPDPQGVLAYDLPGPGRAPAVRRAGARTYEVHIFERASSRWRPVNTRSPVPSSCTHCRSR